MRCNLSVLLCGGCTSARKIRYKYVLILLRERDDAMKEYILEYNLNRSESSLHSILNAWFLIAASLNKGVG